MSKGGPEEVWKPLVQHKVAFRLLQHAETWLQLSWFRPDSTLDVQRFGSTVGAIEDEALRRSLFRLQQAVVLKPEAQIEHLLLCKGPGIMCAIAASLPHVYLDSASTKLPSEALEIDMRGRMDIAGDGKFAYIDLGEIKRKLDYADSVKQLGIRVAVVGWFVQVCCSVEQKDMRLVGRMLVPRGSLQENFIAPDQRDKAERFWNFSLYMHTF